MDLSYFPSVKPLLCKQIPFLCVPFSPVFSPLKVIQSSCLCERTFLFFVVGKPFIVFFWIQEWAFSSCVNTGSIQTDCNLFSPDHWPCHCIINCHKCQCSSPLGIYSACICAQKGGFLGISCRVNTNTDDSGLQHLNKQNPQTTHSDMISPT